MRQLTAFTKKEWIEVWRTGKFLILLLVFTVFGVMNPAIAKLTPWIMEQFSDSLIETGIIVTEVTVDAMASWTQFYKNIPMGLIAFLLMFSGILTVEFQKGTLINMITKGLSRNCIVLAKTMIMLLLWTLNYWLCFGITYVYNAYFWDNGIAYHIGFSAFCMYLFGIWLISLLLLMSVLATSASSVMIGTGSIFFILYLGSMLPKIKSYTPIQLTSALELMFGKLEVGEYTFSIGITCFLSAVQLLLAVMLFQKKKI